MTRINTLIILGVFMFVLAVLAALDLTSEPERIAEGQMVTGALTKEQPDKLEPLKVAPTPLVKPAPVATSPAPKTAQDGILLPLDNGTLRSNSESILPLGSASNNFQAELNKIIIEKPETPIEIAETTPAPIQRVEPVQKAEPIQEAVQVEPRIEAPKSESNKAEPVKPVKSETVKIEPKVEPKSEAIKPTPAKQEPKTTPVKQEPKPIRTEPEKKQPAKVEEAKTDDKEYTPILLTSSAPAKLQGKQKAIQSTRLEMGRTITFQLVGAGPLTAKTILLPNPNRYVVDLQGEWGITIPKIPANLLLKTIRSGSRAEATRLVFELNSVPKSAEVKQINKNTLEVRIVPGN